jgi:hypothetical protein
VPFLFGTYMDCHIEPSVKAEDENLISYDLLKKSSG